MEMSQKNSIWSEIHSKLDSIGFKARAVSFEHLVELQKEIEQLRSQGLLFNGIYREHRYAFEFKIPDELPQPQSILIVAVPSPAQQVTFIIDEQPFKAIIPPVYNHETDQQAFDCIAGVLRPKGHQLANALVPKKLLASRSGLAKYGRHNITYVEGMGSYHRLIAFFTDAPILEDHWQKPQMLARCETCSACIKKCPSGAVPSDRFILHVEKCITYHNESDNPFPDWIDLSWHNCLIGCMICQNVCPENPPSVRLTVDSANFSQEETKQILDGIPQEKLAPETIEKIEKTGMLPDYKLLARNLKVLLNACK
jgi:epoxyqueuosine reductase